MFRPHLEHKHTEPCPFPFEQRYQGKARRQDLVQKELEKQQQELEQVGQSAIGLHSVPIRSNFYLLGKIWPSLSVVPGFATHSLPFFLPPFQKRKFMAQAVPDFQPVTEKPATAATKPQPFNLLTEVRGAKHQEEFEKKVSGPSEMLLRVKVAVWLCATHLLVLLQVKQELEESKMKAEFKATENSVIFAQPFVPNFAPARKPLGEVSAFRLNTEVRAEQRAVYEETKRLHEEEEQRMLALEKEELEREEQRQLMEHRKRLVHHAQPVRQFKPLEVKKSDKSLTAPVAPHFAVDERLANRQQN